MALGLQTTDGEMPTALKRGIHDHWRMFAAEGVILVLLGLIAMTIPLFAGLATAILLGWLLLAAGIVGLLSSLRTRRAPGFGWSLLSAAAALIAGIVLLWHPLAGLVTLTYVLAAYFLVDGGFNIVLGLSHRRELSGRWEWLLLNGVFDLVLAAFIIPGLPGSAVWVLGLIVGIDLLFGGISLVGMALDARKFSNGAILER